ncbi:UV-B-induced protein At3g17800, chloroplastic-like [Primulina eburnea]|uniref:UV-B-induced protein At3g17800, chloroplastic-like n=1 Tax=Primulina eburnea TaxID=1245227 RepID=UPI003C6BD7A3
METVAAFQSSFTNVSHLPPDWAARSGSTRTGITRVGFKSPFSNASIQQGLSISISNFGIRKLGFSRKRNAVRASMQSNYDSSAAPIAPLQLESPIGQFLSQILISHPHLVPAAVEQQLEQLQSDRDAEKEKEGSSASGTELVLYRRIAEVKSNERKKALEEILYALVVQKFMDANVPLVPGITPSPPNPLTSQEEKVQHLHSPEAYEMIQNHLALILGNRLSGSNSMAEISKLRVGQVYAASVMYGYFLKRLDQRFQLEKTMKILPQGIEDEGTNIQQVIADEPRPGTESSEKSSGNVQPHPEVSSWAGSIGAGNFTGVKPSRLRTYVMSFDGETLQRYATIRSKEAINIIEKHTEALFGRPEIVITPEGTIDSSKDEQIKISLGGLKRLVLEAVTFGSFLWDVESYVDMRYHFVAN